MTYICIALYNFMSVFTCYLTLLPTKILWGWQIEDSRLMFNKWGDETPGEWCEKNCSEWLQPKSQLGALVTQQGGWRGEQEWRARLSPPCHRSQRGEHPFWYWRLGLLILAIYPPRHFVDILQHWHKWNFICKTH